MVSKSRRVDDSTVAESRQFLQYLAKAAAREKEREGGREEGKERRESNVFDRDLKLCIRSTN